MQTSTRRIAFIGDIHGYAPALEAAIELCRLENVHTIVGLGDYVDGYDADERCVDLVKRNFSVCVRGNHDEDHGQKLNERSQDWLAELPEKAVLENWFVTHSSPRPFRPDEYIRSSVEAWNCFDECEFDRCVVGHAHRPMLYRLSDKIHFDSEPLDATGDGQILNRQDRYLLANPSLAYNRSGQQNPGFSIYDQKTQRLRIVYLDLPQIDRTP